MLTWHSRIVAGAPGRWVFLMRSERSVAHFVNVCKNLRPAAQEPGVYDVVGVWAAGVGVEAASGSGLGAGAWLIAVDARANDGHGAHCRGRACYSQVARVHDYIISGVLHSKVVFVTPLSPSRLPIPKGLELGECHDIPDACCTLKGSHYLAGIHKVQSIRPMQ